MKINDENTKKRLAGLPEDKRVWIYNADIILEFLNQTFVPTRMFLKDDAKILVGQVLKFEDLKDGKVVVTEYMMKADDLYNLYIKFRNQSEYTSPVETRFKFNTIFLKMRLYKNGWEFLRRRSTRRQVIVYGPLLLRSRVPADIILPPIEKLDLSKSQIDVEQKDLEPTQPQDIEDEPVVGSTGVAETMVAMAEAVFEPAEEEEPVEY